MKVEDDTFVAEVEICGLAGWLGFNVLESF
jgi:hypothetical protein